LVELMDGRRKRSEISRDKLVAAMIALVGEGELSPSAEAVAERAGVGLRTVFRHFGDMEALYAAMQARLQIEYADWQDPFVADDWRGQLAELTGRRLRTYERLLPYKRAADAHRHASATIRHQYAGVRAAMRGRQHRQLSVLPPALGEDAVARETIDLMLSFETWQRLRDEQGLTPEAARAMVLASLERLTA
jgi:AcrR family transcriptional regulator